MDQKLTFFQESEAQSEGCLKEIVQSPSFGIQHKLKGIMFLAKLKGVTISPLIDMLLEDGVHHISRRNRSMMSALVMPYANTEQLNCIIAEAFQCLQQSKSTSQREALLTLSNILPYANMTQVDEILSVLLGMPQDSFHTDDAIPVFIRILEHGSAEQNTVAYRRLVEPLRSMDWSDANRLMKKVAPYIDLDKKVELINTWLPELRSSTHQNHAKFILMVLLDSIKPKQQSELINNTLTMFEFEYQHFEYRPELLKAAVPHMSSDAVLELVNAFIHKTRSGKDSWAKESALDKLSILAPYIVSEEIRAELLAIAKEHSELVLLNALLHGATPEQVTDILSVAYRVLGNKKVGWHSEDSGALGILRAAVPVATSEQKSNILDTARDKLWWWHPKASIKIIQAILPTATPEQLEQIFSLGLAQIPKSDMIWHNSAESSSGLSESWTNWGKEVLLMALPYRTEENLREDINTVISQCIEGYYMLEREGIYDYDNHKYILEVLSVVSERYATPSQKSEIFEFALEIFKSPGNRLFDNQLSKIFIATASDAAEEQKVSFISEVIQLVEAPKTSTDRGKELWQALVTTLTGATQEQKEALVSIAMRKLTDSETLQTKVSTLYYLFALAITDLTSYEDLRAHDTSQTKQSDTGQMLDFMLSAYHSVFPNEEHQVPTWMPSL